MHITLTDVSLPMHPKPNGDILVDDLSKLFVLYIAHDISIDAKA